MIPVDDTHSILVQHARIYRYEISKRQTGVRLFPWVVSPSSCSSSCCCCCYCCRYPDAGSLCISALIGVFAASLGTKAPTPVCAALEFRCHLGGPGGPGVVRPGPGPGLYRHVPSCSWPAEARPCARVHLSAARSRLVRHWVRQRPAAKPAAKRKPAGATSPTARPGPARGPLEHQFASVNVLCEYTQVLPPCRNISATRRTRTAHTCTRRAHSRRHDLLSSAYRRHIMHLSMQTIIKRA